jgi:hypothetical protein
MKTEDRNHENTKDESAKKAKEQGAEKAAKELDRLLNPVSFFGLSSFVFS